MVVSVIVNWFGTGMFTELYKSCSGLSNWLDFSIMIVLNAEGSCSVVPECYLYHTIWSWQPGEQCASITSVSDEVISSSNRNSQGSWRMSWYLSEVCLQYWMVTQVAEGSSLENCSVRKGAGGSNPSPSATDNNINSCHVWLLVLWSINNYMPH